MHVVYIEAVLMDNGELLHFGKSLGYVSKRQHEMVDSGACKLTRGKEPVVAIGKNVNPA
jgi:hypothetical protein